MRITKLKQTPFIDHSGNNLILIETADWDFCNPWRVTVEYDGRKVIDRLSVFAPKTELLIPEPEHETEARVTVQPFRDSEVTVFTTLAPVKRLKVSFVASSHEDLGYCGFVNELESECADYLDEAMDIVEASAGTDAPYTYMVEHQWWLRGYEHYRDAQAIERLKSHVQDGTVELTAPHSAGHTQWENAAQLARSVYFSVRDGRKNFGKQPVSAVFADISGVTQSVIPIFLAAGIRYIGLLPNDYRNATDKKRLPQLFWWEAKSGERMLTWYAHHYRTAPFDSIFCDRLRQYPEGAFVMDDTRIRRTEAAVSELADQIDGDCDLIPVSFYDDREKPTTMLLTVCRAMNEKWAYPTFRVRTPGDFMREAEERFGDTLPVLTGEINDQWADFAAIHPSLFAEKQDAMHKLTGAEALSVLRRGAYPKEQLDDAWWRLCEFDDHCWASSSKHPQMMHRLNYDMTKTEASHIAHRTAEGILGDGNSLWNPLPKRYTADCRLPLEKLPEGTAAQAIGDGTAIVPAVTLPAMGVAALPKGEVTRPVCIPDDTFETEHYRVTCDRRALCITSILEKRSGRELLRKGSRYTLGEFIYAASPDKISPAEGFEVPKRRSLTVEKGEYATVVTMRGFEEQLGANVYTRVIFGRGRSIDVETGFENAYGLLGDYYDRYRKSVFFAFPVNVEHFRFRTDMPLGELYPGTEQLPVSANDFVAARSYAAAENDSYGIAVLSEDMPLFHLGGIHYNEMTVRPEYRTSDIFVYAASNRANQLSYRSLEACRGDFAFSILPYNADERELLAPWSREKLYPPMLCDAAALPVGEDNVEVCTEGASLEALKRSEDRENCIVLLLTETLGKDREVKIRLPFVPVSAAVTDGVEDAVLQELSVSGNTVAVPLKAYSCVTVKVECAFALPDAPEDTAPVRNVFTLISENTERIVCFEKKRWRGEQAPGFYSIQVDGRPVKRIANDGLRIQWTAIGELTGEVTVIAE